VIWLVKPKLSGSVLSCRLQYAKAMFERNHVGPGCCATLWNPFDNLVNCHESSDQNSSTVWLTPFGKCCPRIFLVGLDANSSNRQMLWAKSKVNSEAFLNGTLSEVWSSTLSMPFCQQWNCCFCSPVAEIRAGRFQTPESYNPISRWQFCHHDVFNLSQRISQFLEDLEPRWAAGCYICSKENSAAVKCIKKRLLDGTMWLGKCLKSSGDVWRAALASGYMAIRPEIFARIGELKFRASFIVHAYK